MGAILSLLARETSSPKNGVDILEYIGKHNSTVDDQWYRKGCEIGPTILMNAPVYHREIVVLARESSSPKNGNNTVIIGEVVHNNTELTIVGVDEDITTGHTHRKSDGESTARSDQKMRGGIAG